MGLFSNGYLKPGAGVDPDAPQKRGFFRFFEIFGRKVTTFAKVNLLYDVANILFALPMYIALFMLSYAVTYETMGDAAVYAASLATVFMTGAYISVIGVGPATAGVTYILRNFSREEHAWLWDDFKGNFKSNFRQGICVYVIDIVSICVLGLGILFYRNADGYISYMQYVLYTVTVIYVIMHMYIYQMMVTFKLSLKDIYKNALIFAFAKLPLNLLLVVSVGFIHVGLPYLVSGIMGKYYYMGLVVFAVLEFFITQSFGSFAVNFGVYPTIKKYMLDVADNNAAEEVREEAIFTDDVKMRNHRDIQE